MADYLKDLPIQQVADWYRRLAKSISTHKVGGNEPLASKFLLQYLDNRDRNATFKFTAPKYLQDNTKVLKVLRFHRDVFLTKRKARIGRSEKWAGVQPRIHGCGRSVWDASKPTIIKYHSLVEIGSGIMDIIRIQKSGSAEERDLFTSLRGFQLHSEVKVKGTPKPGGMFIEFLSWESKVTDDYDFDFSEYLTLPNPDYKSTQKNAVRPKDAKLTVYHTNAQRLEKANLAAPYTVEFRKWKVTDRTVKSSALVNKNWSC